MSSQDQLFALTIWPEWAWAIAHFGKDIENRIWPPPKHIQGKWLAIHAGAYIGGRKGDVALKEGLDGLREMAESVDEDRGGEREGGGLPYYSELWPQIIKSAVVAVVKVTGFISGGEQAGWYIGPQTMNAAGQVVPNYGWKLADLITLAEPVPCKGAQGLWPLPPDVLERVRAQVDAARPTGAVTAFS